MPSFPVKGNGPRHGWRPSFLLYIPWMSLQNLVNREDSHTRVHSSTWRQVWLSTWFCLQYLQSLDHLYAARWYFCNIALSLVRYRKSSSLAEKLKFWPSSLIIHLVAAPFPSPHSVYHSVPPGLLFISQLEQRELRCSVSQCNHCWACYIGPLLPDLLLH